MGEEAAGVHIDAVAAAGLHAGDALLLQTIAKVLDLVDAVLQVVVSGGLQQAHGQSLHVTAGLAAVGDEALVHDGLHVGVEVEVVVAGDDQAADVYQTVLLGAHGGGLTVGEHLPGDLADVLVGVAGLTGLDEPGVLSQAGRVDDHGDVVGLGELADGFDVGHGHGLAAVVVAGDGDNDHGDGVGAVLVQDLLHLVQINVALEVLGGAGGIQAGVDDTVHGDGAQDLGVAVEGIEMHVAYGVLAGLGVVLGHDEVGAAALMGGLHIGHAEHLLGGGLQLVEALAAGVALVTQHHGGPLLGAHGGGAGVGEAVHIHVLCLQAESVVLGLLQGLGAVGAGSLFDGLHNLNAEGLCMLKIAFHVTTLLHKIDS